MLSKKSDNGKRLLIGSQLPVLSSEPGRPR
jgi:hypothetical protein